MVLNVTGKNTWVFALFSLNDALAQTIYISFQFIHFSKHGVKRVLIIKVFHDP